MVNNLVFKWPKPLFFMVSGAHGRWNLFKVKCKNLSKILREAALPKWISHVHASKNSINKNPVMFTVRNSQKDWVYC